MSRSKKSVDEYTLAAFMAGTLSAERRREVIAYLAENEDARELLKMAHEAHEASREQKQIALPKAKLERVSRPSRTPDRSTDRAPLASRLHSARRYLVAAVLVLTLGAGLYLALGPSNDTLRRPTSEETPELAVRVSSSELAFEWSEIPDAYHYFLVVWDPTEARVVARHTTSENQLSSADTFVQNLRDQLEPDHPYTLRVDAVNAQNRVIQHSETIEFSLNR